MKYPNILIFALIIFALPFSCSAGTILKLLPINSAGIVPYTTDPYGNAYFLLGQDSDNSWDAFTTEPISNEIPVDTAIRALVEESGNLLKNYGFDIITLQKKLSEKVLPQGVYRIENRANKRLLYLIPIRFSNFEQATKLINAFQTLIKQKDPNLNTIADLQKKAIGWIKVQTLYNAINNSTNLTQPIQARTVTGDQVKINPDFALTFGAYGHYEHPWNPVLIGSLSSALDALENLVNKNNDSGTLFGGSYKNAGILPFIKRNNQVLILLKKQTDGTFGALSGSVIPADKWDALSTAIRNFLTQYQLKIKDNSITTATIEDAITTKKMTLQELSTTEENGQQSLIYPLKITGNPIIGSTDLVWVPATQVKINGNNWQNVKVQGYSDVAPASPRSIVLSKELTAALLNDLNLSNFYGRPDLYIIKRIQNFEPTGK